LSSAKFGVLTTAYVFTFTILYKKAAIRAIG